MIKLVVGILIIACIAPLFIKGPDGEPIMTLDDWKVTIPDGLKDSLSSLLKGQSSDSGESAADPGSQQSSTTTVYKWQDDAGNWHFSNTPPNKQLAEEMQISSDINLMDAYVPPPEPNATPAEKTTSAIPTGTMSATPDQIREMMDTVTNLQETIDQRKADIDQIAAPAIDN